MTTPVKSRRIKWSDLSADARRRAREQITEEDRLKYAKTLERFLPPEQQDMRSKTERKYANHLDNLKAAGVVASWRYEARKFEIAHRCGYTPDFEVTFAGGHVEYHEVKGWCREDAWIKLKVAARMFPECAFKIVKLEKGKWKIDAIAR